MSSKSDGKNRNPQQKAEQEAKNTLNRRNFLKIGVTMSAALVAAPVITNTTTVESLAGNNDTATPNNNHSIISERRTPGSGKFSMEVSAIGLGVMGMDYHRGVHPSRKANIRLLHEAVDRGVTFFDTAETYGPFVNEELAGEVLSQYKDKIYVTTKFGFNHIDGRAQGLNNRPEYIKQVVEGSLKRLRTDCIELYYCHRYDRNIPIEDVAGAVKGLIQQGKVKRFGLSEVSAETLRRAHAIQPVTALQSEFSLMWMSPEHDILPVCEELGIGFVPYSPVGRGFLSGSLNEYTRFDPTNDNRSGLPRFQPEAIRSNTRLVEVLRVFGQTRGMTTAQVALAWLLTKKKWIVPIPGTTKLAHLEENIRTPQMLLTADDMKLLENEVSKITIVGDRYARTSESAKRIGH